MHIGVDFDDVLYPYHYYLKRRIQNRFGIDLSQRRVTTFYYHLLPEFRKKGIALEEVWQEVQATWKEMENHQVAPLLDVQAASTLRALSQKHRVSVVTARSVDARPHVEAFLRRHKLFPMRIRMQCETKQGFDILVDDFPKHALENVASGGRAILYTIDENSTFDESRHPRIYRVHSWTEVKAAVDAIERQRKGLNA